MQDAVPVRLTSKYNTIMSKHGAYLFGDLMRVRFVNYLRSTRHQTSDRNRVALASCLEVVNVLLSLLLRSREFRD